MVFFLKKKVVSVFGRPLIRAPSFESSRVESKMTPLLPSRSIALVLYYLSDLL